VLTQLLDVFSFVSVLLRGAALAFQSLILGGAIFSFWILRPLNTLWGSRAYGIMQSSRWLILWSAVAFAFVQVCYIAADSALLTGTTGLGWREVAGASYFISGVTSAVAALIVAAMMARLNSMPASALLAPSLVILSAMVSTSHAAGRVEGRTALAALGAMHMLAVASWVGGLPYLLLALARAPDLLAGRWLCRRFSALATLSVVVLAPEPGHGLGGAP